ncbi:pantetheine-phosphate adenylyltransferase [Geomonas subterranea]|uniref:Phosphopantetheine adenylyltransferase n=1 Tax=Geomonas subterranea TaxID=2847989 RepID=A0ABX8LQA2_9BACT|nr:MULTISPECIES: pantetheine-phosphate adenylyltransferase [Geomonas]QXE91710.1 pantetheine-phosphate adenylyltransferase [Geomonas subterranea]QXM10197.1 pantetheine-phosphate adenylyltransferase [Geomonas subterranea]
MPLRVAVYPGSFDPVTYGHLDIIDRALKIFDGVIVAVARNSEKNALFTVQERIDMLSEILRDRPQAKVETFEGLLVDYVRRAGATVVIRGLRAVSDFEFEFQLAQMNRNITREVETLFMMTSVPYSYLSSSIVKEVSHLNGPVDKLVPPLVKSALDEKFRPGR